MMMIVWGTLVTQFPARPTPVPVAVWWSTAPGTTIALYVFMADALRAVAGGPEEVAQVLPQSFNWPLFAAALMLMGAALPVGRPLRRRSS